MPSSATPRLPPWLGGTAQLTGFACRVSTPALVSPHFFWLADNYWLLGRHQEARQLFERLLALCNDVGLLSEEYDPHAKRLLGNFPQAFSHVSLINTAYNLSVDQGPASHRKSA